MEKYTISENACIELTTSAGKWSMTWQGSVDEDNSNDQLGNHLFDFHKQCRESRIEELEINFYAVDFMNSSGIKRVISWLREVSGDNAYKTTIFFDEMISWQDITFATFRQLIQNITFIPRSSAGR